MTVDPNRLPVADSIEHPAIREAAQRHSDAQHALKGARRELAQLDGSVKIARMKDAEAEAEARFSGKAAPKRSHEQEAVKQVAEAEHEVAVAEALVRRTAEALREALDEHGADWAADLDQHAALIDRAWDDAVEALLALHADRVAAHARRRMVGARDLPAATARLRPEQLADSTTGSKIELAFTPDAAARWHRRIVVPVADLLTALAQADQPEDPRPMPAFAMADAIAHAAEHAKSVERGYAIGEDNAPAVREGYYLGDGRRVSVHVPGDS